MTNFARTVVMGELKLARYLVAGLCALLSLSRSSCSNSLKCLRVTRAYRDHVRRPSDPGDRFISCEQLYIENGIEMFTTYNHLLCLFLLRSFFMDSIEYLHLMK